MGILRDPDVGSFLTYSLARVIADTLTVLPWGDQQVIGFQDSSYAYEITRLPSDQSVVVTRTPVPGFLSQHEHFSSLTAFRKAYEREDCIEFLTPETLKRLADALSVSGVTFVSAGRMALRRLEDGSIQLQDQFHSDVFKVFEGLYAFQKHYTIPSV